MWADAPRRVILDRKWYNIFMLAHVLIFAAATISPSKEECKEAYEFMRPDAIELMFAVCHQDAILSYCKELGPECYMETGKRCVERIQTVQEELISTLKKCGTAKITHEA